MPKNISWDDVKFIVTHITAQIKKIRSEIGGNLDEILKGNEDMKSSLERMTEIIHPDSGNQLSSNQIIDMAVWHEWAIPTGQRGTNPQYEFIWEPEKIYGAHVAGDVIYDTAEYEKTGELKRVGVLVDAGQGKTSAKMDDGYHLAHYICKLGI